MELQHVNVKVLLRNPEEIDLPAVVPVFHSWIQNQGGGELLLDVADYRHVHAGPGIVLIGHAGNYSVDDTDGRLGIRYNRKIPLAGTNQDRLVQAASAALSACARLENEPLLEGALRFNGREVDVRINDRLLAPNTEETRRAAHGEFQTFFSNLFAGPEFDLAYPPEPRRSFGIRATAFELFDTATVLDNLCSLAAKAGQP